MKRFTTYIFTQLKALAARFTGMGRVSQPKNTRVSNIIRCCNDLPFPTFKEICATSKYELLGIADPEQLYEAWIDILSEFYLLTGDETMSGYVHDQAEVIAKESKIYRVKLLCGLMTKFGYDERIAKLLVKSGYNYNYAENTQDHIDTVIRRLRNDEVKLMNAKKALEQPQNKKPVLASFDEKISAIERLFKVPIDQSKLTTQMYAIKCREYTEEIERRSKTHTTED